MMLAVVAPGGPQALALKASETNLEELIADCSATIRRGPGATFAVRDVLKAACQGLPPTWGSLEAMEPALAAGTAYEILEAGMPCVAMATGDTLMRALRLLEGTLNWELPVDGAVAPIVVMESFIFFSGWRVARRSPTHLVLVGHIPLI